MEDVNVDEIIEGLRKERDALACHVERLRGELKKRDTFFFMGVPRESKIVASLLEATPDQSLAAIKNRVIDEILGAIELTEGINNIIEGVILDLKR